jgi:hypothetical protein
VGAPWSSVAVEMGIGRIVATKLEMWANSPEKVLGVRRDWADANGVLLLSAIKALLRAAEWLDDEANREEAAEILSRPHYVGVPAPLLCRVMSGNIVREVGADPDNAPDFLVFSRYAANFPWASHGVWMMTQMQRWGQIAAVQDPLAAARAIFRADIYRRAASELGLNTPLADLKPEGRGVAHAEIAGDHGPIAMGESRFFGEEAFRPDLTAITAGAEMRGS